MWSWPAIHFTYTLTVTSNGPENDGDYGQGSAPAERDRQRDAADVRGVSAEVNCAVGNIAAGDPPAIITIVVPTDRRPDVERPFRERHTRSIRTGSNNVATVQTIATSAHPTCQVAIAGAPPSVTAGNFVTYLHGHGDEPRAIRRDRRHGHQRDCGRGRLVVDRLRQVALVCQAGNGNLPSGASAVFTIKVLPLGGTPLTANKATARAWSSNPFFSTTR